MSDTYEQQVTIRHIRKVLLIGLESFGEIERITDRFESLKSCSLKPDADLRPIHPTGTADTIGEFAMALRYLENMEDELHAK